MKAFKTQIIADKYYSICFIGHDTFLKGSNPEDFNFEGSYHVLGARLLGLTYPDYLAYCKSKGAHLRGKRGYTYPVWETDAAAQVVVRELQFQWDKLVNEIKF